MPKKTVLKDDLNIKKGGLYCFCPFNNLDTYNKTVFKIGISKNLNNRLEQYHTYYPISLYIVDILECPELTTRAKYVEIEKFIVEYLKENNAFQIHSTTRVRNLNEIKEGATEWFYTTFKVIHEAFEAAHRKYNGELLPHQEIKMNYRYNKLIKNEPNYIGKIVFHTDKNSAKKHRANEINDSKEYAQEILDKRTKNGILEYKVLWEDRSTSWQSNFLLKKEIPNMIKDYEKKIKRK
jgi:hypothetical protein